MRWAERFCNWLAAVVWFALIILSLLLLARPAQALGLEVTTVANLPTCENGSPWVILVVDGASSTDCATGAGATEVVCTCKDGVIAGLSTSGGSSNSFETMNTPSGTDPVADSSTDTLNLTSGAAALSITGTSGTDTIDFDISGTASRCARFDGSGELVPASADCSAGDTNSAITFDIGDDGGNDSTALSEIATTNDNGSAITEPSADKMLIDVSKLRPPSILNPRASPSSEDCEFSGSICAAWTIDGSYSSGTVDPWANVSTFVSDLTSWPGWLLLQGDNSLVTYKTITNPYTPNDDEMWVFHIFSTGATSATTNEGRVGICYRNSGDANEGVCYGFHNASGNERVESYCENNGSVTVGTFNNTSPLQVDDIVLILRKDNNVYRAGFVRAYGGGNHGTIHAFDAGSCTKTGVTTFDTMAITIATSDDTYTPVAGIDFIRYYSAPTMAIMNP